MSQTVTPEPVLGNKQAEQAVIGSLMLLATEGMANFRDNFSPVAAYLSPDDFMFDKTRWMYAAALSLYREGIPPDMVLLSARLLERGQLETIHPGYIYTCLLSVSSSFHLPHYADVVHRLAESRRQLVKAGEMARDAYSGRPPTPIRRGLKIE